MNVSDQPWWVLSAVAALGVVAIWIVFKLIKGFLKVLFLSAVLGVILFFAWWVLQKRERLPAPRPGLNSSVEAHGLLTLARTS